MSLRINCLLTPCATFHHVTFWLEFGILFTWLQGEHAGKLRDLRIYAAAMSPNIKLGKLAAWLERWPVSRHKEHLGGNTSYHTPAVSLLVVKGSIVILVLCINHMSFVNRSPALGDRWAPELLTALVSGPIRSWARPWRVKDTLRQVRPARPHGSLSIYLTTTLTLTLPPSPHLSENPYLVLWRSRNYLGVWSRESKRKNPRTQTEYAQKW